MKKLLTLMAIISVCLTAGSCCGNQGTKNNAEATEAGACCQDDSAIKIIVAYKDIKPEKVDEFIEFTKDIIEASRAEEGCISYTLYQHPVEPTKFVFYEEWKDQAAIDHHFSTDHFKASGERGADFDNTPTVLKIYDACPSK